MEIESLEGKSLRESSYGTGAAGSEPCVHAMRDPVRRRKPFGNKIVLPETVVTMAVKSRDGKTVVRNNKPSLVPVCHSETSMNDNGNHHMKLGNRSSGKQSLVA